MTSGQVVCFHCGTAATFVDRLGFREECIQCRRDLHSCRCCQHYDPKVYNECRETQAEVIREKEKANYCDYFSPKTKSGSGGPTKEDLLAAAENLFKKN